MRGSLGGKPRRRPGRMWTSRGAALPANVVGSTGGRGGGGMRGTLPPSEPLPGGTVAVVYAAAARQHAEPATLRERATNGNGSRVASEGIRLSVRCV